MKTSNRFIHPGIDAGSGGIKKIKAFNITNDKDKQEYELLMNSSCNVIIEETPPSVDKIGRVIVIVK